MKEVAIHILAIYIGWMIGFFGSIASAIWAYALYSVFGERRKPSLGLTAPARFPPKVAFRRLLIRMPLLAFVHPFPWVFVGLGYLVYLVLAVPMSSGQLALSLSVLGGFSYGLFKLLRPLKTKTEGSAT